MFRSLLLVIITIFSWSTNANVQSLTTDQGVEIRVEHREDDNYPLILTSIIDDVNKTIDKYPFEGGEPTLNGMDIIDINNHEYLIVQIIWDIRHFDISGTQYLSYIYKISENKIDLDKNLNDDENLEGFIGHYSEDKESNYKYNNISKLENYLIKNIIINLLLKIFQCVEITPKKFSHAL
ncbi:hypothetical protein B6A42_20840 [Vibrio coralliilyticus]|nr:hypothetical protein B6A42_20840 [Vibrio coralliilyticus]